MSKRRKKQTQVFTISDFYCVECGRKGLMLPRLPNQQRSPGHLKKLYCLNCKKETNHVEIRPFGMTYQKKDFEEEFGLGRFINGERVPLDKLLKCNIKCKYNKNNKCWNANHSHYCNYREKNENE